MTDTYRIPATNYPRLEKEIEKLNRRAKKLDTDPVVLTIQSEEHIIRTDPVWDTEYEEVIFVCSVEGDAPQIEGYTLVAAIQPVDNGENLVREVPGQKCPQQFRTSDMTCEHCNKSRRRNSIYIVSNEFGEYRRVGRNCLQDYLGGTNPESLLGRAEYMMSFAKLARDAEDSEWGGHAAGTRSVPISQFVITCAAVIQKLGWMSRSKAGDGQATADIAWNICVNHSIGFARENGLKVTPKDIADAEKSVAWAAEIDEEHAPNNYLHDLGVCCRQQYVTWDRAGYVGSVLQAYQRQLEAKLTDDSSVSQHVGTVGEYGTFADVIVSSNKQLQPDQYGPRCMILFIDPGGNTLTWFTKKAPEWAKVGDRVTISAHVKKHDRFQGSNQTLINRAKVK